MTPGFSRGAAVSAEKMHIASEQANTFRANQGPAMGTHTTRPGISGIGPLFIVRNVPAALAFYRDKLGFEVAFQGPEPDDIFFGIVERGGAMIMMKEVGVDPVPNCTRDIGQGIARWDAYLHVPDPDALAAEFASRNVEFFAPLQDTDDDLRGFELRDADGYVLFFGRPRS
jgi:catechol 2,3-dioxygenase-like lactoylglutathione lyase family enzyme